MESKSKADLKVYITAGEARCDECGEGLGRHAWIVLTEERRALCLTCADLDHLVFLPAGDAALTRRVRQHSRLWALVLKWSAARKRYEREGLLVENEALTLAESECEADAATRAIRRAQAAHRLAELDAQFAKAFAARVRALFPGCPPGRDERIAEHACRKYSGRVGRSAAAKALDEQAVRLAVAAHVRHVETAYDDLLVAGRERHEARQEVRNLVSTVLHSWESGRPDTTGPGLTAPAGESGRAAGTSKADRPTGLGADLDEVARGEVRPGSVVLRGERPR